MKPSLLAWNWPLRVYSVCDPLLTSKKPLPLIARSSGLSVVEAGQIEKPTAIDAMHLRVMDITGDPLPYGIAPNRHVLEELIRHTLKQGIITRAVTVDELFAGATRGLVA